MLTSFREKALSSASQAGLVNNLNDGLAWGLFPIFFANAGLSVARIGVLAAIYPAVWGLGQLTTGALSDRIGRKPLIAGGMLPQAAAIAMIAATTEFGVWAFGATLLGAGTAMVYPSLLAAIGDVAHPLWRARSVGVYRLWRDAGFAVGNCSPGSSPTSSPSKPPSTPSPLSLRSPASSSSCGCTKPIHPLPPGGDRNVPDTHRRCRHAT